MRPTFALGEAGVYLTSLATAEVLNVNLKDLKVNRRLNVGGTPALLTVVTAISEQH